MGDDQTKQALRIFTWIVPRVNSTALTKFMSFVDDTVVWMEPYTTAGLNVTLFNPEYKRGDPHAERLRERQRVASKSEELQKHLQTFMAKAAQYSNIFPQENFTPKWVKEQLEAAEPGKKVIFIKDQAFAILDHLDSLPENVPTRHVFLIRHPNEVYTSWKNTATTLNNPLEKIPWDECHAANEVCYFPVPEFYQLQYKLWKHVKEHIDPNAVVIDGHDLVSNPEVIIPKFFEEMGIPFKESYLEWNGDPEAVFSLWKGSPPLVIMASYTSTTSRAVHSTKFEPPKLPRGVPNPKYKITVELKEYIEGAMPFYEEMYAHRLT